MSDINDKLIIIIKDALVKAFNYEDKSNMIMIETPSDISHGDYSTNCAMRLAKILHNAPINIADRLTDEFKKNDLFTKVEVVKPGFINFFIKKDSMTNSLKDILNEKDKYGSSDFGKQEKVMVEYVSANPTGDLHLGHARGAAYGDALTRILKFTGYDVLREYYVNDAGHQIDVLANSLFERYKQILNLPFEEANIGYQGKDVINLAQGIVDKDGNKWVNADIEEREEYFKNVGINLELDKIKKDLALYRVSFDNFTSERSLYKRGLVSNTIECLKKAGYTYTQDGALWLRTTDFKDDKDRVLIKSDGSYTYLVPDIAYHKDKFDRGYTHLINLFGADHHGYIARLKAGIKILGYNPDNLEVEIVQMVRIMEGDKEVKMSKRTGNAITIRELCEDVGVDAARYFFLCKPLDSHFDFDLELARKQSSENPIYYIQYAYARMMSILKKDDSYEIKDSYPLLTKDKEIELIKVLSEFKNELINISKNKDVNSLTNYCYKLSSLFHSYYTEEKVLVEDNIALSKERLALIKACSITLKNALNLLGIEAKEKM